MENSGKIGVYKKIEQMFCANLRNYLITKKCFSFFLKHTIMNKSYRVIEIGNEGRSWLFRNDEEEGEDDRKK